MSVYSDLIDALAAETAQASKAKEADATSVPVKAARAASTLYHLAKTEAFPVPLPDSGEEWFRSVMALGGAGFDKEAGDKAADDLSKLLALPDTLTPADFNALRASAEAAVKAWQDSRPRGGNGGGPRGPRSSEPNPDNKGDVRNYAPVPLSGVHVTMTLPDGTVKEITHKYESSISNEITKVVGGMIPGGLGTRQGFRTVDANAGKAWTAARDALRSGDLSPHAFKVDTGEHGVLSVEVEGIPMGDAPTAPEATAPASA